MVPSQSNSTAPSIVFLQAALWHFSVACNIILPVTIWLVRLPDACDVADNQVVDGTTQAGCNVSSHQIRRVDLDFCIWEFLDGAVKKNDSACHTSQTIVVDHTPADDGCVASSVARWRISLALTQEQLSFP